MWVYEVNLMCAYFNITQRAYYRELEQQSQHHRNTQTMLQLQIIQH